MTTTYLRTGAVANNGCVGGNASRASAIKPNSVVRVKFLLPYASPASTDLSWGGGGILRTSWTSIACHNLAGMSYVHSLGRYRDT